MFSLHRSKSDVSILNIRVTVHLVKVICILVVCNLLIQPPDLLFVFLGAKRVIAHPFLGDCDLLDEVINCHQMLHTVLTGEPKVD